MNPRRFSLPLAAAGVVAAGAWVVLPAGSAGAEASYDATARTETFTLTISNPSIPTGIDVIGGGPAASAHQDSVGISDASAQLPYVGETVPGLPGVLGGLFGLTAPPYPFIAATNAGSEPQTVAYPGVVLHAESGDFATVSSATAGQPGSGATASSRIDESRSGDVVATASTSADSVKVGPYATLSDVRSLATVRADGTSGKLTRSSSSSIGRISVPGLAFTVPAQTPEQIPVPVPVPGVPNQPPIPVTPLAVPGGGTTFHDPDLGIQDGYFTVTVPNDGTNQRYAIPAGPVLEALAAQGITVRFQAPQETKTGVIAGTYIFTYTLPSPPPNAGFNGATQVAQTTAYALASVNLQPIVEATGAADPSAPSSAGGGVVAGATTGGVDSVALPSTGPAGALPSVPLAGAGAEPSISLVGVKIGLGVDNLYLAVAALALLGLLGFAGTSWLGVRSR